MYDFHFGSIQEIENEPERFLIFVKRLLPRWINGIPDSECVAIFHSLNKVRSTKSEYCIIETGCGASTLAMVLWSIMNNGHVYSWDTNGSKGSFVRTVISEAICRALNVDIYKYWTFIGFDSTNKFIGIPVLKEIERTADFGYFDSWHTLDHLMLEIKAFEQVCSDEFVIALDDAYYTKKSENYSYLNMLRAKLSLKPVIEPSDNVCAPFYQEVEGYLTSRYSSVLKLDDIYKRTYQDDVFFEYYSSDRASMNKFGMEDKAKLEHRFDSWLVKK